MIEPPFATQTFLQDFTLSILVSSATSITSVTADVVDTGVVISYGTDTVTLSGKYESILPIKWYWKDLDNVLQSGESAPEAGTYLKLIQLDSPPIFSEDCNYTIISDVSTDIFVHTVQADYNSLARELIDLLNGQPGP